MSRFSKAEAEARGWAFFHNASARVEDLGDGLSRAFPAVLRAERYVGTHKVTEEGHSIGQLLERIHLYEKHRDGLPEVQPVVDKDEAGDAIYNSGVQTGVDLVHHDHTVGEGESPLVPGPWPEEAAPSGEDPPAES